MEFVLDTHTHTLASGHAYSTLAENITAAAGKGLALLATTDHAPALPDSPAALHFINFGVLPREAQGVSLLYGVELNILDYAGRVDLPEDYLRRMDIVIASFHEECTPAGSRKENTRAMAGAMENPWVNILGHPNDASIPVDFDVLVPLARDMGVLLEVNDATLRPTTHRKGTREMLVEMLRACEKYGASVSVGSDAHFHTAIGELGRAKALLEELAFPEELVVNTAREKLLRVLSARGGRMPAAPSL